MAIPTLGVEEFQYEDTGILINGDVSIPFLDLKKIDGLDSADIRQTSKEREGTDGGYIDALYENMRTVTLEGTLYADTNDFESTVDDLKANFAPAAFTRPLYFGTDAGLRAVWGKSLGFKYDKDEMRRRGSAAFQVQIVCEDPRIYTPNPVDAEVVLGSTALTGRGYNKSYDYGYGPASTIEKAILNLEGNRPQPGKIRIYGPINNPVVLHEEYAVTMTIALNIDNGDYVEIDLSNRTVRSSGGSNIRGKLSLSGNWYLLQPGTNTFSFSGSSTLAGTTRLVVSALEAAWR
jgi:hypothetical protein